MQPLIPTSPRILLVDDNRAIHDDFRKILSPNQVSTEELAETEAMLFGTESRATQSASFRIDSAYQGADAIRLVEQSLAEGQPYAVAFMDVRMPPGLDGIETTAELWKRYPDLQVVLCTAYSDYSWNDLLHRLGQTDRLVILKKPFDNVEVLQLAHALTEKWRLLQKARARMADLEAMVSERTARLQIEIAQHKQTEAALRESQQVILRQERLAAVGQLSAGVAHDFNNIMTVIRGHAGLLLLKPGVPALIHPALRQIEEAAARAAHLTRQLLAFSRKQAMQPQNINLADVVRSMADMIGRALGEQIVLKVAESSELPAVHGDPSLIEQVLMNLSVNARDAMPSGGDLTIELGMIEVTPEQAARNPEARSGQFVRLSVRDTGCGMDRKTLDHIFEPFFTTKEAGKGTGLGLATVYGIVKQHEGWIQVESQPGEGTRFHVFFPAVTAAAEELARRAQSATDASMPVARGQGETVLVVEDEPALRDLVRRIMQSYGYTVIEARSGREALELWHKERERIDLLLTDIVMPEGISGKELAKRLTSEDPHLKIVFTSGYDKEAAEANPPLREGVNFLRKPYSPPALARIVHRCLEGEQNEEMAA